MTTDYPWPDVPPVPLTNPEADALRHGGTSHVRINELTACIRYVRRHVFGTLSTQPGTTHYDNEYWGPYGGWSPPPPSRTPHTCPICQGSGQLWDTLSTGTGTRPCHGCLGTGIVWG